MDSAKGSVRRWLRAPFLSRRWLLTRAGLILVCLCAVHMLGWRENVSFLSGTPADGGRAGLFSVATGITYALVYFAAVVGAPILGIAAALLAGMDCMVRKLSRDA